MKGEVPLEEVDVGLTEAHFLGEEMRYGVDQLGRVVTAFHVVWVICVTSRDVRPVEVDRREKLIHLLR